MRLRAFPSRFGGGRGSLTVLSANASISSVDDCVTRGGMGAVKGSGEFRAE